MRFAPVCATFLLAACASAPPGPTDAEVRMTLDGQLQQVVSALTMGDAAGVVAQFEPAGQMVLRGVMGPDGDALNVDLTGPDEIRSFLGQVGAPPDFSMQVTAFERTGGEARQTGRWSIAGEQFGTFAVDWRQTSDGVWQIGMWRFDGG